jgi:O-antigen ligase
MISRYLNWGKIDLLSLEIGSLILLLFFLPSFEAPKNLFLVTYVAFALYRQFKIEKFFKLDTIDYVFIFLFFAALLSAIFSSLHHSEWRGFRSFSFVFIFAWTLMRARYSKKTIHALFVASILSVLPALIFGLYELFITHHESFLKIHSVGYVNASGVYLTTIASATLAYFLSLLKDNKHYDRAFTFFLILSLFAVSLLIASSRSSFVALALTGVVLIFFSPNRFKKVILGGFATFFIISFLMHAPVYEKHMMNLKNHVVLSHRDKLWNVSIETFRSYSSLSGIGIGNYHLIKEDLIKTAVEKRGETYEPHNYFYADSTHNVYLSFLVERGYLGFLSLMAFMFFWAYSLIKQIYLRGLKDAQVYCLWGGSLAAFSSVFLAGFVHTTLVHEPAILALFFLSLHQIYARDFLKK